MNKLLILLLSISCVACIPINSEIVTIVHAYSECYRSDIETAGDTRVQDTCEKEMK